MALCLPFLIGMLVFEEKENWSSPGVEKNLLVEQGSENQQQTLPTFGVEAGI